MIDAAGAMRRFGLGPRPGDLARLGNPRAALRAELGTLAIAIDGFRGLPSAPGIVIAAAAAAEAERQAALTPPQRGTVPPAAAAAETAFVMAAARNVTQTDELVAAAAANAAGAGARAGNIEQRFYLGEMAARQAKASIVSIGFVERLLAFWTNHFAIEARAGNVERELVGAFEREALRPFVLGRFRDMLGAATKHAAMLSYLDNAASIGPRSQQGIATGRGLNENHARELLELHTIGVDGGYTQDDVIALAKILTGWTFVVRDARDANVAVFAYRATSHEPGTHTVMGIAYPPTEQAQGEAVLNFLAAHPATARHLARKLVRHFVPDEPAALVDMLADTFITTGGDLRAVALALIDSDLAWSDTKRLTSPQEYFWYAVRALNLPMDPALTNTATRALGQGLWEPPSPAGFADGPLAWLAPDALTNRLDLAEQLAQRARPTMGPVPLSEDILGQGMSLDTRFAVISAASQTQALSLMLMSPEFQRR